MKLVKFKGPMGLPAQSARHLDQATLERLGVLVPETSLTDGNLVFGPSTNHTIEMSNEASESLVAALPDEFEVVEGETEADADAEAEAEAEGEADQTDEQVPDSAPSKRAAKKAAKHKTDDNEESSDDD